MAFPNFLSFLGRVLFASLFILSAYQEFSEYGFSGGPAAEALKTKLNIFTDVLNSKAGIQVPQIQVKYLITTAITLKSIGGILFIFGSSLGAYLLLLHQLIITPILYDFYNYYIGGIAYDFYLYKFTQSIALFGALLFFIGMKNSMSGRRPRRASKMKTN